MLEAMTMQSAAEDADDNKGEQDMRRAMCVEGTPNTTEKKGNPSQSAEPAQAWGELDDSCRFVLAG